VEERWDEFAFGRLGWVFCRLSEEIQVVWESRDVNTVGECDFDLEQAILPYGVFLARHCTVPLCENETAIGGLDGFGNEAKGVIAAPGFAVKRSVCRLPQGIRNGTK
jgi:hypothetical protein